MLYVRKAFRTLCSSPDSDHIYRYATLTELHHLTELDILPEEVTPEHMAFRDLNDLSYKVKTLRHQSYVMVFIVALLVLVALLNTTIEGIKVMAGQGHSWAVGIWIGVGIALSYLLYRMVVQAIEPTIHDCEGHWVELKTGKNNMFTQLITTFAGEPKFDTKAPGGDEIHGEDEVQ